MNKHLLPMAWRNITRNRRRSMLNIIALSIGMTIMIIALGWIRGYFTTLYTGMMEFDTGQVQITHRSYMDESRRSPLDLLISDYPVLREQLLQHTEVTAVSGRISYELEIGNGQVYIPMQGRAIDPQHETEITTIHRHIDSGRFLQPGAEEIVLGHTAAKLLKLSPGDTVYLRTRDRFDAPNTAAFRLAGIFRLGYPLFDRYVVFSDLEQTSQLLRTGSGTTHAVLTLQRSSDPQSFARRVQEELPDEVTAYPWQRFAQTMIAAVEADMGAFILLIGILFLLILLGILNSMSMTVRERGREIGTMRAIGLKRRQLQQLLISESALLALIAAAIAVVCGGLLAAYIQRVGFDVAAMMPADMPIPFGERFYGDYRFTDFAASTLIGIITAVFGSLLPAHRAIRIEIVDTMRLGSI